MIVGALGDVVFSVSSRTLKTISNFVWSGSARYATHDLHAGNSISEYTGTDLAKITFDIQLLASLGVDPMSEIWRLFDLERQGRDAAAYDWQSWIRPLSLDDPES